MALCSTFDEHTRLHTHTQADRYMQSGADAANDPFGSYGMHIWEERHQRTHTHTHTADAGPPPIPLMPGFPPASPFGPYGGVPGLPPHPNMPPAMPMWYEGKGFPQYGKGAAGGGRRGGGGGRGSSGVVKQHPYQATPPHAPAAPAFTPEDFPTLVKQDGVYDRGMGESTHTQTPPQTQPHTHIHTLPAEVIRWGKTDIIKILAGFAKEVRSGARSFAELGVDLPSSDVCPAVLEKPNFDIELTKPVAAAPGAGPSFADAVKRGGKKPVPAKKAPAPASTPAAAPAAAATSAAAPTPAAAAAATAPAAEPKAADKAEGGEEAPVSPGGRKSWVEAAIHAGDVKVAAPTHHTVQVSPSFSPSFLIPLLFVTYLSNIQLRTPSQYRAGYASAQAEKEETPATGKKGGRGGGKGGKASKGGRGDGSGRGGGKRGGKKGDGEGKGARKGSKKGVCLALVYCCRSCLFCCVDKPHHSTPHRTRVRGPPVTTRRLRPLRLRLRPWQPRRRRSPPRRPLLPPTRTPGLLLRWASLRRRRRRRRLRRPQQFFFCREVRSNDDSVRIIEARLPIAGRDPPPLSRFSPPPTPIHTLLSAPSLTYNTKEKYNIRKQANTAKQKRGGVCGVSVCGRNKERGGRGNPLGELRFTRAVGVRRRKKKNTTRKPKDVKAFG